MSNEDARARGPGMPLWVKAFLIAAVVLAAAFVVTRLAGVQHGPGLHGPRDGGSPTARHGPPVDHAP